MQTTKGLDLDFGAEWRGLEAQHQNKGKRPNECAHSLKLKKVGNLEYMNMTDFQKENSSSYLFLDYHPPPCIVAPFGPAGRHLRNKVKSWRNTSCLELLCTHPLALYDAESLYRQLVSREEES